MAHDRHLVLAKGVPNGTLGVVLRQPYRLAGAYGHHPSHTTGPHPSRSQHGRGRHSVKRVHPRTVRFYTTIAALASTVSVLLIIEPHLPLFPDRGHIYWLLGKLPYLLLPLVSYLGLRLNQTRIVSVSMLWLACYALVRLSAHAPVIGVDSARMGQIVALCLPLCTIAVILLPETRLFGPVSLLRAAICVVPLAILIPLAGRGSGFASSLLWHPTAVAGWLQLPLSAIVAVLLTAALLVVLKDSAVRYFQITIACCLLPLMISLNANALTADDGFVSDSPAVALSLLSLVLGYAVFHTYWEKAYIDELTGIQNRRALNERLYRLGRHFSVAMIDIDYFKAFNDTYGHAQGDTVLRFVASHLGRTFPGGAFRYGGEEFCVLFDGTPLRLAARRVEAARQFINSKDFFIRMPDKVRERTDSTDRGSQVGSSVRVHISFSAGVAYRDLPEETPEDVIEMADKALYGAKRNGRGRVSCYAEA